MMRLIDKINICKLTFVLLFILVGNTLCFTQVVQWEKRVGDGAISLKVNDAVVDNVNASYSCGYFTGKSDFDPDPDSTHYLKSDNCGFIVKLDSNGSFKWVRTVTPFNNGSRSDIVALTIDSSNNIYAVGYFSNKCDLDLSSKTNFVTSQGREDIFLLKLDSSGNTIWIKHFGGKSQDYPNDIHIDAANNIIISGVFQDTTDLDPSTKRNEFSTVGNRDIFIAKYSEGGNFIWARTFGSKEHDATYGITTDNDNNVYTIGTIIDTIDMDPGVGKSFAYPFNADGFLHKLDKNGKFKWFKLLSGSGLCYPGGVKVVGNKVYVSGAFTDSLVIQSGSKQHIRLSQSLHSNHFVLITDTFGSVSKIAKIGGKENAFGRGIDVDSYGNIFTFGTFRTGIDLGVWSFKSYSYEDGYFLHMDSSLNVQWALHLGSYQFGDYPAVAYLNKDRYLFAIGYKWEKLTVLKIDRCSPTKNHYKFTENVCDSLVSPSGKYVWKKSGTYYDTASFIPDCKYYYRFDLTFNKSTESSIQVNACDFYRGPSGYLNKSGKYTQYITNQSGCDSVVHIDLTIRKSSSFNQTFADCKSIVSPSGRHTWTSSGEYQDTIRNSAGCDSIILAQVQIQRNTSDTYIRTCDSFTSPSGKYKWYKTGDYKDTIANSFGCDSAMAIKLKIDTSTWGNQTFYDCEEVKSPSQKYTWNETGTYYDTIKNLHGCGHFITANVNITKSKSTQHVEGCGSFVSPSGKYLWTNSGKYLDTIPNSMGCDSIITTNLIVDEDRSSVYQSKEVLIANARDKNYQWFKCTNNIEIIPLETNRSFIAQKNGSYGVIIWDSVCTDTSSCYLVKNLSTSQIKHPNVSVHPNPSSGYFVVTSEGISETCKYVVTNVKGVIVQEGMLTLNNKVPLNHPAGIYFLTLTADELTYTTPIIVE